jgi:DNA-binding beta-propeller fold protein YncE
VKIEEKYVRTDGKIEVEFTPKVPGKLELTARFNEKVVGVNVSNVSLVLNVKPQQIRVTREFIMKDIYRQTFWGIVANKENSKVALADLSSHCVRVFNSVGDLLLTYGSQGSGQGQLSSPGGLSFLNETDLVIADCFNHRICIVNTTTGTLVKTFGKQGKRNGEFYFPYGVHVDDDGNITVSDRCRNRVQVFTEDGDYQYQFGLTKQDNFDPISTVTHRGLFYVSDHNNNVIHVFEKKGNVPTRISTIGGEGSADGQLSGPWGLAIDNDHNLLVCDHGNNRIQKFTLDGRFVGKTCDDIKDPKYIAVLHDGQFLVSTSWSGVFFCNVEY